MGLRRGQRWWTSSKKGKFELLALTETKLKGNGEVMVWSKWHHCWSPGDGKKRTREGVAVLLNDVWHNAVSLCFSVTLLVKGRNHQHELRSSALEYSRTHA